MVIIRSSLLSPAGRHFHLWLRVRITFRILLSSRQSRRWNDSTVNTDHDELLDRGRWRRGGREDLRLPAFALTIFARRLVPLPRWLPIISQWKPSIELFYICWSSYFSYLEIEKYIYIESSIRDSKNKISISLGFRWLVHSWRQHEWSFEKKEENEEAVRNASGRQFDVSINQ